MTSLLQRMSNLQRFQAFAVPLLHVGPSYAAMYGAWVASFDLYDMPLTVLWLGVGIAHMLSVGVWKIADALRARPASVVVEASDLIEQIDMFSERRA